MTNYWKALPDKRDWMSEFLVGFSLPRPGDFLLRLQMNARRFQRNYLYVFGVGLTAAVLMNPYFLLSVALICAMGKFALENPISVKDHMLSNQEKTAVISSVAILLNYLCGTFHTLLMGTLIGLSLIFVHIVLHNPFERTTPPGAADDAPPGSPARPGDHEV